MASAAATMIATASTAAPLVRDSQAIATLPIQGITLAMTAEEAFSKLRSMGFAAGNIEAFDDWTGEGLELVRGSQNSADGVSWINLARSGDVLISIGETWNRPQGERFDAKAEVGRVQSHLNIGADEVQCRAPGGNSGSCQVQDAEDGNDVDLRFTMTALPTMIMRSVSRRHGN